MHLPHSSNTVRTHFKRIRAEEAKFASVGEQEVCSADTAGVQIFFTLDGSKPAAPQRVPAGGSRKYSEPIVLPAGRVAVRAVAITR